MQGIGGNSTTDDTVVAGSTYYYEVAGTDDTGIGAMSPEVSVTYGYATLGAPATARVSPVGDSLYVAWTPVVGAQSYDVFRGTSSGAEVIYKHAVNGTTYTDATVVPSSPYYYIIEAVDAGGGGGASSEVSGVAASGPPPPPLYQSVSSSAQSPSTIRCAWSIVTAATSYDLYRATSPGGEGNAPYAMGIAASTEGIYSDTEATPGQTYYYEIASVDENGEGARSQEVSCGA
jgi:fibronectin type 3 domain-containing protein